MTRIDKLKNSLLWLIRWILYPVVFIIVYNLIIFFNQVLLGNLVWWRAIPIWTFLCAIASTLVFMAGSICPNPKFGNFLFLGLFVVLNAWDLYHEIKILTALQIILRVWADITIITGFVLAATYKKRELGLRLNLKL